MRKQQEFQRYLPHKVIFISMKKRESYLKNASSIRNFNYKSKVQMIYNPNSEQNSDYNFMRRIIQKAFKK